MDDKLTTDEVKKLVEDLTRYVPEEKRERFLPTREQTKVLITFLRASRKCEGVTETVEMDATIPKRSVCIGESFKELHPETERWAQENPEEFEEVYQSVVYK